MSLLAALLLLRAEEQALADALRLVSKRHPLDSEVHELAPLLAAWSDADRRRLAPFLEQYGRNPVHAAQAAPVRPALSGADRFGGLSLLLDLQDLARLSTQAQSLWIIVALAAQACFDRELDALAEAACARTERQLAWCRTQIKLLAPQMLHAPPPAERRSCRSAGGAEGKDT